jgi:hypothetical protein
MCSSLWLLLMLHDTPSSNALALKELTTRPAAECLTEAPSADAQPPRAVQPGARPKGTNRPANPRLPA